MNILAIAIATQTGSAGAGVDGGTRCDCLIPSRLATGRL